jgi:plasmid stabilization system protein ParE
MPVKIVWSRLASRDFENILQYLDQNWERSVSLAFIDTVEENISFIKENPWQFP